jgi:cation diffusion facilitator family transporter
MPTESVMSACCDHNKNFDGMSESYRRILWWIIAINGGMFIVEMISGVAGQSQALQADALDFLGDSLTYGLSLWVIGKSISTRSNVALFKGYSLVFMALLVFAGTIYRLFVINEPHAMTMGIVAIAALVANLTSVWLLRRHKDGDANVRSVWLCSRNDAIGNVVILIAASGVWLTANAWIDLGVAAFLAVLFLNSAWKIVKQANEEKHVSSLQS